MIPAVLLEVLGAAIASIVSTASDPISGLPKALPGWVVTPYLFVAIITLFAVNTIDLYSSGLTLAGHRPQVEEVAVRNRRHDHRHNRRWDNDLQLRLQSSVL